MLFFILIHFSSYVDNSKFPEESKLEAYGDTHFYINHKEEFCSPLFPHIHTNNIENLWKLLKGNISKMRMTSNFTYAVAQFYFHETLSQEEQILYITKKVQASSNIFQDEEGSFGEYYNNTEQEELEESITTNDMEEEFESDEEESEQSPSPRKQKKRN